MKHHRHALCALACALIIVLATSACAVPINPMRTPQPTAEPADTAVPAPAVPAPVVTGLPPIALPATPTPTASPTAEPTPVPTATPAPTATPTPTPIPTPVPTLDPNSTAVPAMPEDEYINDGMLDAEMIAQLDAEVADYLIGTGRLIETVDGIRNILLVGVDARPGETRSRSDTIIVLTIDGNGHALRLTSFLRDMYVSIPGHGNNRINTAWVFGGFSLLRQTLIDNFGLTVDEYVCVDLTLLTDMLDEIGGLTLTVESEKQLAAINGVIDGYNYQFHLEANSDFLTHTGEQHMNGKQVQAYARYRRGESDFHRTQRQREVLEKVFDRLKSLSVIELSRLVGVAMSRLDTNMTISGIVSLIPIMYGMSDASITELSIPYAGEYQDKTVSGMMVLVPNLAAAQQRIEAFVNGK